MGLVVAGGATTLSFCPALGDAQGMGSYLLLILMWVPAFALIGLWRTWWVGYRDPIDWWYHEIRTDRRAGVWYYGSLRAARQRRRQSSA